MCSSARGAQVHVNICLGYVRAAIQVLTAEVDNYYLTPNFNKFTLLRYFPTTAHSMQDQTLQTSSY
jgi:hypothetical protein